MQGSSYAVVGVLGVLLVMVLLYVLTSNGINTKKDSVARATSETAVAEKRIKELSSYGNFSQVKEQRVSSVKQLANGRIDWERLARGLAHVLPQGTWLTSAKAAASGDVDGTGAPAAAAPAPSTSPQGGGSGATGASGPQATPQPAASGAKPSLELNGCARKRHQVAVALVRLRELSGAEDVQLVTLTKPMDTGATDPAAGGGGGGGGTEDCGTTHGRRNVQWTAKVIFKPGPGSAPSGKVPVRLGGGQ
jgi:Tfp pilus assembly protein PilN